MAKRWTIREDLYLAGYLDSAGGFNMDRDLDRPRGASLKRAKHLKTKGAWQPLLDMLDAKTKYTRQYLVALGDSTALEFMDMFADDFLDPPNCYEAPSVAGAQP